MFIAGQMQPTRRAAELQERLLPAHHANALSLLPPTGGRKGRASRSPRDAKHPQHCANPVQYVAFSKLAPPCHMFGETVGFGECMRFGRRLKYHQALKERRWR